MRRGGDESSRYDNEDEAADGRGRKDATEELEPRRRRDRDDRRRRRLSPSLAPTTSIYLSLMDLPHFPLFVARAT